jgi:hypothetical protein
MSIEQPVTLSAGTVPLSSYGTWQQEYTYSKTTASYGGGWSYGENGDTVHAPHEEQVQAIEHHPGQSNLIYPPQ